jgi:hypothetical protein
VLALRGDIVFDGSNNFISFDNLLEKLSAYLFEKYSDVCTQHFQRFHSYFSLTYILQQGEQVLQQIEKSIKLLPPLQYGLDVNFNFREYVLLLSCDFISNKLYLYRYDNFEKTDQCNLFDYFRIRLLHGWLVNPAEIEVSNHSSCNLLQYC